MTKTIRRVIAPIFILGLHISLSTIVIVIVGGPCASQEALFKNQTVSDWVAKLEAGSPAERREAALAMAMLAPQRLDVVDLLIPALDQRTDYDLQSLAASALKNIGPFAEKAIPALVRTLGAPDIEDNSVREQAASALSVVAKEVPVELTSRLEKESREAVVHGLLRALGYLRASDLRTLSAIIAVIEGRSETLDGLYEKAVWTLDRIGEPAVATLIDRLRSTKSLVVAAGMVDSLGKIYFNLEGREAPADVVEALLGASRWPEPSLTIRAVVALQSGNARSAAVNTRLKEILSDDGTDSYLIGVASRAGAKLFPKDTALLRLSASKLTKPEASSRSDIIEALKSYDALSTVPLLALMRSDPKPDVLYGAARVFASPRFASAEVVSALSPNLDHANQEVVEATLDALAELGPSSLESIPQIARLASSDVPEIGRRAMETVGRLAQYMLSNDAVVTDERRLQKSFETALRAAGDARPDDPAGWQEDVVRPISVAIDRLMSRQRFKVALISTGVFAALLAVLSLLVLSWRVRRWLRVLSGSRWILHVGECDYHGRVVGGPEGLRLALKPANEGQSAVFERIVPKPALTPDAALLGVVRSMLGSNSLLRIEVEEAYFGQPWAKFLAGPWNDPQGNIGGQIALAGEVPKAKRHYGRTLAFRALASSRGDNVYGPLAMASAEAEAVGARFRNWGADVSVRENEASSVDLLGALREADLVHISAHANFDRILLSDGPFTTENLAHIDLAECRCRLLVLSACEAGDLNQRHALLWMFVKSGINVIAATRPVHDMVCKVLFEEFYTALLPQRQAVGINLASAVRSAVEISLTRLLTAFKPGDHHRIRQSFDQTAGSFVIFGDPSLSLQLVRPESGRG